MAHSVRLVIALLHIFALSFIEILEISNGSESNIYCLRSVKDSLEDTATTWKIHGTSTIIPQVSSVNLLGVECWHPDANEVLNIQLSHMMLRGQFPCDIENCTRLTGLDLSANELSGPLSFDIGDWSHLSQNSTSLETNFPGKSQRALSIAIF